MPDATTPRLSPLLSNPDVLVIGAGSAGIGAARRLLREGLSVAVLEARHRVGGRAHTVMLRGHPVDLGAHWLHAGPINPLVKLGRERGEPLRRAPGDGYLVIGRRLGRSVERRSFDLAFAAADRALTLAARAAEDRPAAKAIPPVLGPYGGRVAAVHALVSGLPLDRVSLHDFPSMEYSDNLFLAGGYGAYLARLATGLPVALGAPATVLDWSGEGVRAETPSGIIGARAAVVTVPMPVLQAGGLRFVPELPDPARGAAHAFLPGVYEHVVLHWPGSPFRRPDRLASLLGTRHPAPGLLARIDGTPFHYFEMDEPLAKGFDRRDPGAPGRHARLVLAEHFGNAAIRSATVPAVSAWRHDPWSLCSWAVVPPGSAPIRDRLKEPVGDRIWFAGEALSRLQWGTVGGAWEEGERAAGEVAARLARAA